MLDKILRALAICDVVSPTIALAKGGVAFRVSRYSPGVNKKKIKKALGNIPTHGWVVDSCRNEIRFAVSPKYTNRVAAALRKLGVSWWGG